MNKLLVNTVVAGLVFAAADPASAATRTITLSVPGMTCAACPITIKKALTKVEGVSRVDVALDQREAAVTFDDARTTAKALTQAVANAGYPATVKR